MIFLDMMRSCFYRRPRKSEKTSSPPVLDAPKTQASMCVVAHAVKVGLFFRAIAGFDGCEARDG
jgi:hypothetical protein